MDLVRPQPHTPTLEKPAQPDRMLVRYGQYTDAGRKADNQDCLGVHIPEGDTMRMKGLVAAIADGVSAAEAGREAAEACVRGFVSDYYSTPDSWTVETSASRVLGALNRWLHGRGHQRHGDTSALVTTFSAVVIRNRIAYLFHIGDSRISLVRNGRLERLTRDHHAALGNQRFALARAMGVELNVEIDVHRVTLQSGDRLVMTTDGIHGVLDDKAMVRFGGDGDPAQAAESLGKAAYRRGSDDNLTALVLVVDELPREDLASHYERLTNLPFPPLLKPGHVLDGYRIIREIHASTRTQVYLAEPPGGGATVVLKTPSPNYVDDPAYIDRFLNEIWVSRRVNSPHVVQGLALPDDRQCLYALTEHVQGQTLREWMQDNPKPSLARVRDLVRQIALGLRALHRLEMVHQDLKPENIMVDQRGTARLIDLGSVRIRGVEQIAGPWANGAWAGTASYAAPECLNGEPGTPASDRYSLGVIAYEMLTGTLPRQTSDRPGRRRRPDYRSARDLNPGIPPWVDACLRKAVAERAANRYQALSEFLQDLEHPNPELMPSSSAPLIERVPSDTWCFVATLSILLNVVLLMILFQTWP
ncbi:protein kinase [Marinobacter lacisalsi]|uniref:Protein kinase n=1 Tax=Marinobacter lacisalsi TaxID=475979 RepID=A0ABV8QGF2_9GAMM